MNTLKETRSVIIDLFNRKLHLFNKSVRDGDHIGVLRSILDEINDTFVKLESTHNQMIPLSESLPETESLNQIITDIEELKIKANSTFKIVEDAHTDTQCKQQNLKFSVKKLSHPLFNGEIRLYPTFKSDFLRLMESRYGKDSYVLRTCLTDDMVKDIHWIDDYDLMWERLDDKYGSAPKIVNYVITNIKNLKAVPEGNHTKMLDLINVLERGWYDLKRLGKQNEIQNTTVTTRIEKLLPPSIMRDLTIKRHKLENQNGIFQELMKFLLNERKVIEYIEEGIRKNSSTSSKYTIHNVTLNKGEFNTESAQNCNESKGNEYLQLFKKFQESQVSQNEYVNSTLSNLTTAFNNLTKLNTCTNNNYPVSSSKWCPGHQSPSHDLPDCYVFKKMDKHGKLEFMK